MTPSLHNPETQVAKPANTFAAIVERFGLAAALADRKANTLANSLLKAEESFTAMEVN